MAIKRSPRHPTSRLSTHRGVTARAAIAVALAAAIGGALPTLAHASHVQCDGVAVNHVFVGTSGDDHIVGNSQNNTIHGVDGDDVIEGRSGDDRMCGGNGRDTLVGDNDPSGTNGEDTLRGGPGCDGLYGNSRQDELDGLDDSDLPPIYNGCQGEGPLWWSAGLFGGDYADSLHGGAGNDFLDGDNGDDVGDGESGTDRCRSLIVAISCEIFV